MKICKKIFFYKFNYLQTKNFLYNRTKTGHIIEKLGQILYR